VRKVEGSSQKSVQLLHTSAPTRAGAGTLAGALAGTRPEPARPTSHTTTINLNLNISLNVLVRGHLSPDD